LKKIIYLSLVLLIVPALVLGAVYIISTQPLGPDEPRTFFLAGNAYSYKGDYATAVMNYEQAVKLNPHYEEALSNLAIAYNKLEMYTIAAGVLRQLVLDHPENATYSYDYAINLVLSIKQDSKGTIEEVDEALSGFRKAEELSPGYLNAKENIAFLEELKRNYGE
jgi:tetratricopeptide (TPR) repeat protein